MGCEQRVRHDVEVHDVVHYQSVLPHACRHYAHCYAVHQLSPQPQHCALERFYLLAGADDHQIAVYLGGLLLVGLHRGDGQPYADQEQALEAGDVSDNVLDNEAELEEQDDDVILMGGSQELHPDDLPGADQQIRIIVTQQLENKRRPHNLSSKGLRHADHLSQQRNELQDELKDHNSSQYEEILSQQGLPGVQESEYEVDEQLGVKSREGGFLEHVRAEESEDGHIQPQTPHLY